MNCPLELERIVPLLSNWKIISYRSHFASNDQTSYWFFEKARSLLWKILRNHYRCYLVCHETQLNRLHTIIVWKIIILSIYNYLLCRYNISLPCRVAVKTSWIFLLLFMIKRGVAMAQVFGQSTRCSRMAFSVHRPGNLSVYWAINTCATRGSGRRWWRNLL